MRCLFISVLGLSAVVLGSLVSSANAADIYYKNPGSSAVLAVDEAGGPVRTVLTAAEVGNFTVRITCQNHLLSNGQAFIRSNDGDIELLYRAPDGTVHTKLVTDLAGNTPSPSGVADTTRDDSAFSFRTWDNVGNYRLYRLNVSVDEALAPDYVPPADYSDPRLELLVEGYLNPATGYGKSYDHAWDGTGTRVAYHDLYEASDGEIRTATRVLDLTAGTTTTLYDSEYGEITFGNGLDWNPASSEILLPYSNRQGLFTLHADAPGVLTTLLPARSTTVKGKTTTDYASQGLWRPDGGKLAFTHVRITSHKSVNSAPAVTTGGWGNALTLAPFFNHYAGTATLIGWSAATP
jgi:hypothetical protein